MENFESSLAEILEEDDINWDDELSSFDSWDSMTILSIIAFSFDEYKVTLSADEIKSSDTVIGLKKLIEGKM